jgi:hypothetical protein
LEPAGHAAAAAEPHTTAVTDIADRHTDWLFDRQGLPAALDTLRTNYRNRAAHTEILGEDEFKACSELVIGPQGLLWALRA